MSNVAFPSLKARQLLRVLAGLGYRTSDHRGGSHRWLKAHGRRDIRFAWHDNTTIPGGAVRRILVKDAGLTLEEAKEVMGLD